MQKDLIAALKKAYNMAEEPNSIIRQSRTNRISGSIQMHMMVIGRAIHSDLKVRRKK